MSDTALATRPACFDPACHNAPAAACARCARPFCVEHGLIRGKRFRGLPDVCNQCRNYSPLRYFLYLLIVVAVVLVCAELGRLVLGEGGFILGLAAGVIVAVVALWRFVPE